MRLKRVGSKPIIALMTPYGTENNGVRILASVLKAAGYAPHTIFFKVWRNNDVVAPTRGEIDLLCSHLRSISPDLVGIGFGSPYLRLVRQLSHRIREATGAKILAGGIHPTFASDTCVDFSDGVAIGEGEPIIAEIARRMEEGTDWRNIPGLRLPEDGVPPCPAPDFVDLDSLPHRDFSPENKVLIEGNRLIPGDPLVRQGVIRVHASRGCPYSCAYCYESSLEKVYGKRFRFRRRSVDSLLDELKSARRHFSRFRRVKFDDDTFIFPKPWLEEFCRRWPEEIGLPFDILLNPEAFRAEDITMLAGAGLAHVQMGVETAGPEEAGLYNRRNTRSKIIEFARLAQALKLEVNYDLILDNPLATSRDRRATLDLLLDMPRPFRIFLYSLNVFPESGLYETMAAAGVMTEAEIEGKSQKCFHQFRVGFDWPRPPEERAHAALLALSSKPFIPAGWVRALSRSSLMRRPGLLTAMARVADALRLFGIGLTKLRRGELTWVKVREYGSFRRLLTQ